jgi:hypothetical protein
MGRMCSICRDDKHCRGCTSCSTQTVARHSSLSKCHTVSQYMHEYNLMCPHKQGTVLFVPIFIRLTHAQSTRCINFWISLVLNFIQFSKKNIELQAKFHLCPLPLI